MSEPFGRRATRRLLPVLGLAAGALVLIPSALDPSGVPAHRDLLDFFLPLKAVASREMSAGNFPFWDPWTTGGQPFFANLQSQLLYPPNLLVVATGPAWGLSLLTAFHLVVLGLGAVRLASGTGRSASAALLAGVATAFGGFAVSLSDLHNQLCTSAWLPWMAAAAIAASRAASTEGRRRALSGLAAAAALAFLGGAPQLAAAGAGLALLLGTVAARGRRLRAAAAVGGAGLLAVAAVAVQLAPFAALALDSDRVGSDFARGGRHALAPSAVTALVVAPEGPFDGVAGVHVRSIYLGGGVLALAALGALRRRPMMRALLAAAVGSTLLAFGPALPILGPALVEATPWLRYPVKWWVIAAVSLPQLAAAGLDLARAAARRAGVGQVGPWALLVVVAVGAELVAAGRPLWVSLPATPLLEPTPAIRLAAAQTHADGPRLAAPPLDRQRLERRARAIARGDVAGAARERVELLEGALPALFAVHATWGANALTWAPRADLIERLEQPDGPIALQRALEEARAGYALVDRASAPPPWPVIPIDGGAARLLVVPDGPSPPPREWLSTDLAVGPAGLGPPAPHPGWREGPPGTWTFRPRGFHAWAALSVAAWVAIAALALPRRRAVASRAEGR